MSDAIIGHGAALTVNDGTSTTTVGNIISISGPNETRDSIDVSTMDSASKQREFLAGMLDAGELTAELNYDGTALGTAHLLHVLRTTELTYSGTTPSQTWKLQFYDRANTNQTHSHWQSAGFITSLGHTVSFDDKVTESVTIKFSGVPTYTDVG